MIARATHVYCLSESHRAALLDLAPEAAEKTELLRPDGDSIADPYGGDLAAYRAAPVGEGPWPGPVLVHAIFGLDDEMRRHADRLAAMGYLVLAPDLLVRLQADRV